MTDNRANEPTPEQVDAAAKVLAVYEWVSWEVVPDHIKVMYRAQARAALVAAQGAGVGPQEPCPQPCEHLSAEDARDGRDCREHPCTCPTAPSSDREKLIEEARAVVPQAETPQCGPCRRGQHGCCDGNEYLRCECSHGAAPVLPSSGAPQDPERIMLRHPDGTPKSNDEIRSEAAAMREGAAPQAESDERIQAWERLVQHPVWRSCFEEERPLIDSMMERIDKLAELEMTVNELAPATVLPSSGVDEVWRGLIVTASFENGVSRADCGLEDCECPEHEQPPIPAGTYVTVRLDNDERVGLTGVEIRVLAGKEENE